MSNWHTSDVFDYSLGNSACILSIPHCGTLLPKDITERMTDAGCTLADTDWFVDRLYDFASELNISIIKARYSRYLVDLNRNVHNESLYPGQFTTTLCPTQSFLAEPLYQTGEEPDSDEVASRARRYWHPYHQQLQQLVDRAKISHGYAVVFDAHSIASEVPTLFDGKLLDLNFGTNDNKSCDNSLATLIKQIPAGHYQTVWNGRFKGGYICRHYGQPGKQQHAVQLELAQSNYMDEQSGQWHEDRASQLQEYLKDLLGQVTKWRPANEEG